MNIHMKVHLNNVDINRDLDVQSIISEKNDFRFIFSIISGPSK